MDSLTKPFIYTSAPVVLLSIVAITLNVFVIKYYWKAELNVVSLLYKSMACMDIITAMGIIHMYVVFLLLNEDVINYRIVDFNAMIFCFFVQVCSRCSVFYNLMLAVSRTTMILKPFSQINIKMVKLTCIAYAVPWIVLYGLNIHEFSLKYAKRLFGNAMAVGMGLASLIRRTHGSSISGPNILYIVSLLPDYVAYIIPVIIVIITCVIQVISLHRSSQFPTSSNQRHVTITVLLMSTLFVLCNTPYCGFIVAALISQIANDPLNESRYHVMTVTSAILFPVLNAALNPAIIITRSGEMRRKFADSLQIMLRAIRVRPE